MTLGKENRRLDQGWAQGFLGLWLGLALTPVAAAVYVVDAPGKLTTIAGQIQAAPAGGVHIVRFRTYENVGTFSLTGLTADSLIFERFTPSASVLTTDQTLFYLRNVKAAVVIRALAFKLTSTTSILVDGSATTSPNGSLSIDSSICYGSNVDASFLTWKGGVASKVLIRRSILSAKKSDDAKIDLSADSIVVTNSYLNLNGLLAGAASKHFELSQVTTNRIQFALNGAFTGTFLCVNSIFAHPPIKNRLVGGDRKFAMTLSDFASKGAQGNLQFDTWTGFDYPVSASFPGVLNTQVAPTGDSLALWNFSIQEDTQRGYRNPSTAGYPAYNQFPEDPYFNVRLNHGDSIRLKVDDAEIPRVLDLRYASQVYPSNSDTTRSLWLRDTVLSLAGPAVVDSIYFPEREPQGRPILFAGDAAGLTSGPAGADGGAGWRNTLPAARRFLPAFGGQNTPRRSPSRVTGLPADSIIEFSQVTLAGRTSWRGSLEGTPGKRLRIVQKNGAPIIIGDSTTAQVAGSMVIGVSKAGSEVAVRADSLAWWSGGRVHGRIVDSASAYWYKGPAERVFSVALVERLGVGRGRDTVELSGGHRLISISEKGFHLDLDTTYTPSQSEYPKLGLFRAGIAASWPGRQSGDTVIVELRKSHPSQRPFRRYGSGYAAVPSLREDSQSVTISAPIDMAGKPYFLAREYAVGIGLSAAIGVGKDTLFGLRATRPGDIRLDTTLEIHGLPLDSLRVLVTRRFVTDNLLLEGNYTLKVAGQAPLHQAQPKAYALRAGRWDSIAVAYAAGEYRFALLAGDSAVVAVERIPAPQDTSLPKPAADPFVETRDRTLILKPVLTASERAKTKAYMVEISTVNARGRTTHKVLEDLAPDSTLRVDLEPGTVYDVKVGYASTAGRIYWSEKPLPAGDVEAFRLALNASAPTYTGRVRELVGVPEDIDLQTLLAGFSGEEAAAVELDEWQEKWTAMGPQTRLRRGKGYLLALPKDTRPAAAPGLAVRSTPDTLKLDTGWNLISNPRPYPFAATAVALDPSGVSDFHSLSWTGVGKAATYAWRISDTLQSFAGYAVHATRKTELVFDSRPISPLKKVQAAPPEIALSIRRGEVELAHLVLQGHLHRPSPPPPFLGPRTWAVWAGGNGLLQRVPPSLARFEEAFEIHSNGSEELVMDVAGIKPAEGSTFALWDPVHGRLTAFEGAVTLKTAAGANSYALLALPVEDLPAKEEALRAANPLSLRLAAPAPNPARNFARVRLSIPAGQESRIRLEASTLDGRQQYSRAWRSLAPGHHDVGLNLSSWTPGTYVLRLEAQGPRGTGTHAVKLLVLEGAP